MTDAPAHALFSPSSAHKWMRCEGALAMEQGAADSTSEAADEGTAAHHLAALVLTDGTYYTRAYQGRVIRVVSGKVYERGQKMPPLLKGQRSHSDRQFEVDEEMCEKVQVYVDAIRGRIEEYKLMGAIDVTILVENRVDISEVVGVEGQFGTSDIIIIVTWADGTSLISIEDLKFGYRMVFAPRNEQMMVYANGALKEYALLGNFTRARMVIHQPNRDHVSDWECSVEELQEFAAEAHAKAQAAKATLQDWKSMTKEQRRAKLTPGEKQCQWCKAKGTCEALAAFVANEVIECDFEDLTKDKISGVLDAVEEKDDTEKATLLARYRQAVPLIDIFCRGVLAASDAFVLGGGKLPGWKVVQGKKGNRKWTDPKVAEEALKAMRLKQDEIYDMKVISPTSAEELLKSNPKRWAKIKPLYGQADGKPAVVEESDKRPPLEIKDPEGDFEAMTDDETA